MLKGVFPSYRCQWEKMILTGSRLLKSSLFLTEHKFIIHLFNICEYIFSTYESNETPLFETGTNGSFKALLEIGYVMALASILVFCNVQSMH